MERYILAVDQSTQGTKALLFNRFGEMVGRSDRAHRQIINEKGWVSHDAEEIYRNLILCVQDVVRKTKIEKSDIICMGISNQRETALTWDKETGIPVGEAVVWQCSRAKDICEEIEARGEGELIRKTTGIPVSPYFPAAKLRWILENNPEAGQKAKKHQLCMGTVDSYLIYRLTGGKSYKTDYSNASRTQLFNIRELMWDKDMCRIFHIPEEDLPQVCDSDAMFGLTDLEGYLDSPVPIHAVLGDSHGALFGQGCLRQGMCKATYGTGTSVMLNIGEKPMLSTHGLVTSLAWKVRGKVQYVMEGNINYSGATITWLKDSVNLLSSSAESQKLAEAASKEDTTYLVPAFSGLGAPYWKNDAKAVICGMTRLTGKAEIVRAGLESIAYQITDVIRAMEVDCQMKLSELRIDGGAAKNGYLVQFQSDILNSDVLLPDAEELSGIGAAYLAGISSGYYNDDVFQVLHYKKYMPHMENEVRKEKYTGWTEAVKRSAC